MRDTLEKTWTLEKEPSLIYQLLHNLEETAALHTIELGIPRPVMVERYGVVWMIVRSWMQLDKQPDPASDLTVRTWHRGMTGSMIYRDFDLIQNGERIGQAVQTWVLVDIGSRTLFRMSKVAELANSPRPETVKDVKPRKLAPPCALRRPGSCARPRPCAPGRIAWTSTATSTTRPMSRWRWSLCRSPCALCERWNSTITTSALPVRRCPDCSGRRGSRPMCV